MSPGGGVSHPDEPDEGGASELDLAEREAKMHRDHERERAHRDTEKGPALQQC